MMASGQFELLEYSALSDGSYTRHSGFAIGNPLFMGAFFGAQAIANASNRRAAQRAAMPRWHVIDQGVITVSTYGFYMETPTSLLKWGWDSIDSLEVVQESVALMRGRSTKGPVQWALHSDWAELVFVLWASAVHPNHPQFASPAFVSAEWIAKAHAKGFDALPSGPTSIEAWPSDWAHPY